MANTSIVRSDDIILSVYQPEQTYQTIHDITEQTRSLIAQLRVEHKPVKIMIDVSQVTSQDTGARKAAMKGISTLDYDKMAVFGASVFIKHVASFIIQATGKADKVKYFNTQEEAEQWLNQ